MTDKISDISDSDEKYQFLEYDLCSYGENRIFVLFRMTHQFKLRNVAKTFVEEIIKPCIHNLSTIDQTRKNTSASSKKINVFEGEFDEFARKVDANVGLFVGGHSDVREVYFYK